MTPIQRLYALRDELLDLTKGRTADGKPTHIPPPKSAAGQAKARAAGYSPVPGGKTWAHSSVRRRGEGRGASRAAPSSGGGDLLKEMTHLRLFRQQGAEQMTETLAQFSKPDLVKYARRNGVVLPSSLKSRGTAEDVAHAIVKAAAFKDADLKAEPGAEHEAKQQDWDTAMATRHKPAEHTQQAMEQATSFLRREMSDDQVTHLVQALGMRTEMLDNDEVSPPEDGHDGHLAAADALFDVLREQARTNPTFARALAGVLSKTVYLPPPGKKVTAGHLLHLDPFTTAAQGEQAFRAKFDRLTDPQKRQVLTAFNLAPREHVSSMRGKDLVDLLWDATSTKRARMERRP